MLFLCSGFVSLQTNKILLESSITIWFIAIPYTEDRGGGKDKEVASIIILSCAFSYCYYDFFVEVGSIVMI